MRLVNLGILAVLLCGGCAMQTGTPTSEDEGAGQVQTPEDRVPAAESEDRSVDPFAPSRPVHEDTSSNGGKNNPEPSPWTGQYNPSGGPNTQGAGGTGVSSNTNAMHAPDPVGARAPDRF